MFLIFDFVISWLLPRIYKLLYTGIQSCVAYQRRYVLRNASLGSFVIVLSQSAFNTNLDGLAYYIPRLDDTDYCSKGISLHNMLPY